MSELQVEEPKKIRAALYVDGFNLYYPLCKLGANHYKWLDLWKLGKRVAEDRSHTLVSVTYCTAYRKDLDAKRRHQAYVQALESANVKCILGHYIATKSDPCHNCGDVYDSFSEKQSDINLALSLFADAKDDTFDWAYLLTADSDQTATAKFLKSHYPEKRLVTVAPPGQEISTNIANEADGKRRLNVEDIKSCLFPPIILRDGDLPIRCPREYEPPRPAAA
ncbi:NYN domain-containing protein [Rhizobium leguminosarum]|uniref:NYN domain-containing protein n=1 Tax=Rhizobium leguminosarum TaxID=384 RepID=UPI003F9C02D2